MTESLCFKIEGEFLTDIAREWYFVEHKDYSKSEELIMSCMMTDDDSEEITEYKKQVALDIIEGRMMFTGVNQLSLVEDTRGGQIRLVQVEELTRKLNILKKENEELTATKLCNDALQERLREVEKERDSYRDTLNEIGEEVAKIASKKNPVYRLRVHFSRSNMVDPITLRSSIIGGSEVTDEMNQELKELCDKCNIYPAERCYGTFEWMSFYDKDTEEILTSEELIKRGFAIVDDELFKENEYREETKDSSSESTEEKETNENKYGWLSPDGVFTESPWGTHEEKADQIIEENHWKNDYYNWQSDEYNNGLGMGLARDYLVHRRGWVLLDNPSGIGRTRTMFDASKITDDQKVFLYNFFIGMGDLMSANMFSDNK